VEATDRGGRKDMESWSERCILPPGRGSRMGSLTIRATFSYAMRQATYGTNVPYVTIIAPSG
jgi:hypothetical protein